MIKYSFPPLSNSDARILLLGTMPSEQSLAKNEYYGNHRNAFWKILFCVFKTPFATDYEKKKSLLLENKIALWDVLDSCVRDGSLDSAIEQEVPNNFDTFFKQHPNIKHIYFNGQKAATYFKKHMELEHHCTLTILPSTSPAHAGKTFEAKCKEWRIIQSEK